MFRSSMRAPAFVAGMLALFLITGNRSLPAQERGTQCISIEFFYDSSVDDTTTLKSALEKFSEIRPGLLLHIRDIHENETVQTRLKQIGTHFGMTSVKLPAVYGMKYVIADIKTSEQLKTRLTEILRLTAYVRSGCPHCQATKAFLGKYGSRYPALEIVYKDVISDATANQAMQSVVRRYRQSAASLPVIHYCNALTIGFDRESTTGKRVLQTLDYWSRACPAEKKKLATQTPPIESGHHLLTELVSRDETIERFAEGSLIWSSQHARWALVNFQEALPPPAETDSPLPLPGQSELPVPEGGDALPPPPADGNLPLPMPGGDLPGIEHASDDAPLPIPFVGGAEGDLSENPFQADEVELPVFGVLNASKIGMPAFTIAIGLVDGFNPCAMWVLMFLLSLLVNLKSRSKMFAIAGVFVLISGLAYFAFMAAWLNVFMLVGYLRPVQLTLGILSLGVGAIHIKDFFAFKKGISLSIPESAKPGIYARARKIITAETMWAAMFGAIVLAVLVNIIELLCTAGLPALYTNVLTMQQFPPWKNYAYLALYNIAYMFDDSIMVIIAVATLGKRKLQEKEGRWLKLISGALIFTLGALMIFKPTWLA